MRVCCLVAACVLVASAPALAQDSAPRSHPTTSPSTTNPGGKTNQGGGITVLKPGEGDLRGTGITITTDPTRAAGQPAAPTTPRPPASEAPSQGTTSAPAVIVAPEGRGRGGHGSIGIIIDPSEEIAESERRAQQNAPAAPKAPRAPSDSGTTSPVPANR